jgi:hypothetical protein
VRLLFCLTPESPESFLAAQFHCTFRQTASEWVCRLGLGPPGRSGLQIMNAIDDSYARICDKVWTLYQAQLEKEKRRAKRQVLLPPPPRNRPVDWLFVGISPSKIAPVAYGADRKTAEQVAQDFAYVSAAGNSRSKLSNDAYYEPLLQFARRRDERFGVWPQISKGEKSLLLEFTDALHITTDHRIADDMLAVMNPQADNDPVCATCKEILEAEIALYRPKVVVCNGRLPSKFVWEICTGRSIDQPVKETMLKQTRFGCSVHFSGYLHGKWMDGFARARLLREITEHTTF